MARNPFHQLDVIRKASQKGKKIMDCYRLMYKRDLWLYAYERLYPNSAYKVNDRERAHRLKIIDDMIAQLKAGTFRFFNHIDYAGNQLKDKLIYEVIKRILETIYEPIYSIHVYGKRERRGHLSLLAEIKNSWNELTWCMKGEFNQLHDFINDTVLLNLLAKKIDDRRFLLLIHHILTHSAMAQSKKQNEQKKKMSNLLSGIYLHEFDLFMEKLMEITNKEHSIDLTSQKIKYVRFKNEFVIGIRGPKYEARSKMEIIKNFLEKKLNLHLANTTISHLKNRISFLGYEFKKVNVVKDIRASYIKNSKIRLEIPKLMIERFALKNGYGNVDDFKITHRSILLNKSELDILTTYNRELNRLASYYCLADNFNLLDKLFYVAEGSFIKTIAYKRKTTSRKAAISMRRHRQGVLCLVKKDKYGHEELQQFVKLKNLHKDAEKKGIVFKK